MDLALSFHKHESVMAAVDSVIDGPLVELDPAHAAPHGICRLDPCGGPLNPLGDTGAGGARINIAIESGHAASGLLQ